MDITGFYLMLTSTYKVGWGKRTWLDPDCSSEAVRSRKAF